MAATRIQVVIDCNDVDAMLTFWSEATGYVVEDIDAFVRHALDQGWAQPEQTAEYRGRLRWRTLGSLRHPDDPADERNVGQGRRILLQQVPEAKTTKDRIHLDLLVGPDRRDAEVERIVALGASVLRRVEEHGSVHVVLADPEGNEFCVA